MSVITLVLVATLMVAYVRELHSLSRWVDGFEDRLNRSRRMLRRRMPGMARPKEPKRGRDEATKKKEEKEEKRSGVVFVQGFNL